MPYEIESQDGIVVKGIPDDIPADHPSLKAKVAKARAERDSASVLSDMSGSEKLLAGAGMGMARVGRGIGQLTGLTDQSTVDEAAPRDAALSNTGAGMAGDIVGNLALTAVPGLGVGGLAARGATAVLPRLIAPLAAAGATGATINATTAPVETGNTRGREAAIGGAGGMLGDVGARVVSRVAQPLMQSEVVKRLLGEGIVPTPGQAAGADSFLGQTEQKATSVLGVGDIIKNSRDRAAEEFRIAAQNRGVPAGYPKVTQSGTSGQDQAYDSLSRAYDHIFAGKTVQPDRTLALVVNNAKQAPILPLTAQRQQQFDAIMDKVLWQRIPYANAGPGSVAMMPADKMKSEVIGDLGKIARDHLNSSTAEEKAFGEALMAARDSVQAWIAGKVSQGNPAVAKQLAEVDRAYANHIALDKAVERAKAGLGKFTPNQAQSVTKEGQSLRDLANDAQGALGSRVPDSGTTGRMIVAAALGGGGAWTNEHFGGPSYLSALALAPLAYSRAGSRYAVGNLIPGQSTLADLARRAAPATAQGGRALNEAWQNRLK